MEGIRHFDRVAKDNGSSCRCAGTRVATESPQRHRTDHRTQQTRTVDAITDAVGIAWTKSLEEAIDEAFAD